MTPNTLQKKIMRRVYMVYCLKCASSPTACKLYALGTLFAIFASVVSIGSVLTNMATLTDPMYLYDFMMYSFMHTETIVQLLIVAIAAVGGWMLVGALRNVKFNFSLKKA